MYVWSVNLTSFPETETQDVEIDIEFYVGIVIGRRKTFTSFCSTGRYVFYLPLSSRAQASEWICSRDIYCDADSIMFVEHREEPALMETRNELGAMTYELRPSVFIEEFVSVEPTMPTRQFQTRYLWTRSPQQT